MNKPYVHSFLLTFGILLAACPVFAQDTAPATRGYSLQAAIDYALANNITIKNAQVDAKSAAARVGEIRSVGLPQVNAQAQLIHNIVIQNVVLENGAGPFSNPDLPADAVLAFPFQLKNNAAVTLNANQLLFDGSYFIGLRAASTYKELARKNLNQSKIETVESVTKAYYSVLVNRERLDLLAFNVNYLDTLVRETQAMFDNGFVEQIDVDRLEVQLNNLKFERERVERLQEVSVNLLKFQMGLRMTDDIALTDSLYFEGIENYTVAPVTEFDYNQRNEYSTLQTQKELAYLDVRNNRSQYLPQLSAFGTFGYNPAATEFNKLFDFKERWFDYSLIGLTLNVPIFDGLSKHYKIQQAKLAYEKTEQSLTLLQNSIDLEIRQATVTLTNNLNALKSQKRNLDLASEVVRVSRIKYQQGVGSNIEVNNAITAYREAETNYAAALYDAIIAKVDLDKATGKLLSAE